MSPFLRSTLPLWFRLQTESPIGNNGYGQILRGKCQLQKVKGKRDKS